MSAVKQILATDTLEGNDYASYLAHVSLQGTINQPLGEYVAEALHLCQDQELKSDRPRLAAVRSRTQVASAETCADLAHKCTSFGDGSLVRLLCPRTCKCGTPRAGLYADGPTFGCVRQKCRSSDHVELALASIACQDESVDVLKTDTSWIAFWNQYEQFWGNRIPFYSQMKTQALTHGCKFDNIKHVCDETAALGSIRTYCPITCGCSKTMHSDCPTTCAIGLR